MAEFVLCCMLSRERHFYQWSLAQRERRWKAEEPNYAYRTLSGLTVAILGCSGHIGMEVARTCHRFGMQVRGLASQSSQAQRAASSQHSNGAQDGAAGEPPIVWFHTAPAPDGEGPAVVPPELLHDVDYLVNVLPSTPSTRGLLGSDDSDGGVLRHCRRPAKLPRTVLINVGRGDVISESALLRALLGSNYAALLSSPASSSLPVPGVDAFLAGAVLDVFQQEPLPSSHPFYHLSPPLLTITPHVAATSAAAKARIVDVFLDNLTRFLHQQPLLYEVDKSKGY